MGCIAHRIVSEMKNMPKRTFCAIRDEIVRSLGERPKNAHELQVSTKTSFATIMRHLEYLKSIGIVQQVLFRLRRGESPLWTLVSKERGD